MGKSDAEEFEKDFNEILDLAIKALEQEPQTFKWCTDCKEYDQEKHCCYRWSKVIRDAVEEMKQEYIERDVLDKIRAEIAKIPKKYPMTMDYENGLKEAIGILHDGLIYECKCPVCNRMAYIERGKND